MSRSSIATQQSVKELGDHSELDIISEAEECCSQSECECEELCSECTASGGAGQSGKCHKDGSTFKSSKHIKQVCISLNCLNPYCAATFSRKANLHRHMQQVHKIPANTCLLQWCNQSFETKKELLAHYQQNHADESEWPCRQCTFQTKSRQLLLLHTNLMHFEGIYKCARCDFVGETQAAVRNHHRSEHDPHARCHRVRQCCGKTFWTKKRLQDHMLFATHPPNQTPFNAKRQPMKCPVEGCDKSFDYAHQLRLHKLLHQKQDRIQKLKNKRIVYRCSWKDCSFETVTLYTARRHVRIKHLKLQPYEPVNPEKDPMQYIKSI